MSKRSINTTNTLSDYDDLSFVETGQLIHLDTEQIMLMYLIHSLPYAQSAFNWLFYAFLNRNLRQSSNSGSALFSARICRTFWDTIRAAPTRCILSLTLFLCLSSLPKSIIDSE